MYVLVLTKLERFICRIIYKNLHKVRRIKETKMNFETGHFTGLCKFNVKQWSLFSILWRCNFVGPLAIDLPPLYQIILRQTVSRILQTAVPFTWLIAHSSATSSHKLSLG